MGRNTDLTEALEVLAGQLLGAQHRVVALHPEVQLVGRVHQPIAVHYLAQRLRLVPQLIPLGPAEGLVIVLERHPAGQDTGMLTNMIIAVRARVEEGWTWRLLANMRC